MELDLETEIYGVPIIILSKPDTIAWKMKSGINGERYGNFYPASTPLKDVIDGAAAALRVTFGRGD